MKKLGRPFSLLIQQNHHSCSVLLVLPSIEIVDAEGSDVSFLLGVKRCCGTFQVSDPDKLELYLSASDVVTA